MIKPTLFALFFCLKKGQLADFPVEFSRNIHPTDLELLFLLIDHIWIKLSNYNMNKIKSLKDGIFTQ